MGIWGMKPGRVGLHIKWLCFRAGELWRLINNINFFIIRIANTIIHDPI